MSTGATPATLAFFEELKHSTVENNVRIALLCAQIPQVPSNLCWVYSDIILAAML